MLFPFQTLIIVAHSFTLAFTQSTISSLNHSAIALPLSFRGVTTTTSDANNPLSNTGFACENGGTGSLATRPPVTECTKALFLMPQSADTRTFVHDETAYDLYQLPRSYRCESCMITIRMVPGVLAEITSWDRIGLDATRVVFSCDGSTEARSMGRTGGQVRTGASRGILISVYNTLGPPAELYEDPTTMINGSSVM